MKKTKIFGIFVALVIVAILFLAFLLGSFNKEKVSIQCAIPQTGYKLCKRPLAIGSSGLDKESIEYTPLLAALMDTKNAEDNFITLQHFHFFKTAEQKLENEYPMEYRRNANVGIDENCMENNFSNFGFFAGSIINCSEKISDYKYCSDVTFESNALRRSLDWLIGGENLIYGETNYNCQAFAFEVLDGYQKIPSDFFGIEVASAPQCFISSVYERSQKQLSERIKESLKFKQTTNNSSLFLYVDPSIFKWELNPSYEHEKL